LKLNKYQSFVNQSNSRNAFFETEFLCLLENINKGLIFIIISLGCLCLPNNLSAQGCDYLPGDITLNHSPDENNNFYTTVYFMIEINQNTIVQINEEPTFLNVSRGFYEAYAVTYKTRDSILNLVIGQSFENIISDCINFSAPFSFSVCAPPILSNLEESQLEVCADNSSTVNLTDSLTFMDLDNALDTFFIFLSIIESPDAANDTLDVDLSPFIGLTKNFTAARLTIHNVRSPLQVQAILRATYFFSSSTVKGNRKIAFQVGDGINLSNMPNRAIIVAPLPTAPTQIFRKKKE